MPPGSLPHQLRESRAWELTLGFTPDLLLTLAPLRPVSSLENCRGSNSTFPENVGVFSKTTL